MPRPLSTVTSRPELGALAYEYAIDAAMRGLIADRVLPIFETPVQAAQFPIIPSEAFLKIYNTKRASRAAYNRSDYDFDMGNFACNENGWEELIDDREAKLYARFFSAEEVAMKRAMDVLLRSREKRVADMIFNTNNLTNAAASIPWNELAACDPRADVLAAIAIVKNVTGVAPNAVVITKTVFDNLLMCKKFLDHVQFTDPVLVKDPTYQANLMAAYLGVEEVIVADSVYDTAKKGQATSASGIWNPAYAGVVRVAKSTQDLREPCIGRTFLWTEDSPQILTTETYREEGNRSGVIRVRHDVDEQFVFQACGRLITAVTV